MVQEVAGCYSWFSLAWRAVIRQSVAREIAIPVPEKITFKNSHLKIKNRRRRQSFGFI
jgi:hypothetical protein